jgi:hypothetical protein
MKIGYAKNTAASQQWLNSCEAVKSWREHHDFIEFSYDECAEVWQVPDAVKFNNDDESRLRWLVEKYTPSVNQKVEHWWLLSADAAETPEQACARVGGEFAELGFFLSRSEEGGEFSMPRSLDFDELYPPHDESRGGDETRSGASR